MRKSRLKKLTNKFSAVLLLVVLLVSLVASALSPTVDAADPDFNWDAEPKPTQLKDLRLVYSALDCLSEDLKAPDGDSSRPYKPLSKTDVESFSFFSDRKINVGFDIAKDYGQLTCKRVGEKAEASIEKLFGSKKKFLENFYEYKKDSPGAGQPGDTYYPKAGKYLDDYMEKASFNNQGILGKLQMAYAFSRCFDEASSGFKDTDNILPAQGNVKYKPVGISNLDDASDEDLAAALSKKIPLSKTLGNSLPCQTIYDIFDYQGFVGDYVNVLEGSGKSLTTGVLRNTSDALFDAISVKAQKAEFQTAALNKITDLFAATPDVLSTCWTSAGFTGSPAGSHRAVAKYLTGMVDSVDGDAESTKEESLKNCLKTGYGAFLTDVLDELADNLAGIDATTNAAAASSTADTDSDKCLEGDSILGWVVCPIIEKIQSTLGVLEGYIGSMLKFDLANVQGEGGTGGDKSQKEIRESWNIFRSLASILIIIGFLTALTVKAIRGE